VTLYLFIYTARPKVSISLGV